MRRFDVLDRMTDPLESHLLEASAGTGKTFAIQHLVVRLLLSGSITIEQILVVTFTRAATRELKERIRLNLTSLLTSLENGESAIDYVRAILEQGEDAVRTARENIEAALACFDSAQIFTIHAFCHRMLAEFAFLAHVGLGLNDPDAGGYHSSLRQSIGDFFRTQLKPSSYSVSQISAVLNKYKHDIEKLSNKLIQVSQKKGEIASYPEFIESHARFLEGLKSLPHVDTSLLMEDYEQLKSCYKNMTSPVFFNQIKQLAGIVQKRDCSPQEFDALIQSKDFFLEKMDATNLKVRARLPGDASLHYPGMFDHLKDRIHPTLKTAGDPLKTLLRMAKDFQNKWTRSFEHQEQLSHDQLLTKMAGCLEQPGFCEAIRLKYRAAIIDEFQDTDPVQWSIFKKLFLSGSEQTVYLVGDPKQSIYGFRNADMDTYLDAAREMGAEKKAYLDTNFRSDPSLVTALNALFTGPIDSYVQVKARNGGLDHPFRDEKGRVHFFIAEGAYGKKKNWLTSEIEPIFFFPFIAREMIDLHEKEKIPFPNMAVLVRDRFQASKLQKFLSECGIPSYLKRAGSLLESEALPLLKQLLEAALDPKDPGKIKTLLAGPLIGWQHLQIKTDFQGAKATLWDLSQKLLKEGFASFFGAFLRSHWEIGGLSVLEKLAGRETLDLYADLSQLAEILIEDAHQAFAPACHVLSYLEELACLDPEEDERLKRRPQSLEDAAAIMTIHASKGLEFDVVFALGVSSRLKSNEEEIRVVADGRERILQFDSNDPLCRKSILEQDAEKLRHLYVALTRAKKRVYVPAAFDADQKEIPFGKASSIELFLQKMMKEENPSLSSFNSILETLRRRASISYEILSPSESKTICKTAAADCSDWTFSSPPLIRDFPECIDSFSSLMKNKPHKGPRKSTTASDSLPAGLETGKVLHRILEKVFASNVHRTPQSETLTLLVLQELENTHLKGWESVIVELVRKTLLLPLHLNGKSFCLSDIVPSQMFVEMEFIFSWEDSLRKGFIDLVFEHEGKYYLLDWKSNWLGKSEEDYQQKNILSEMEEKGYFLQASIYATALKRYVKLFDMASFEELFGGAIYFFLRGQTIYHFFPDLKGDLNGGSAI